MNSHSESYRQAGVDITAGYRAVDLMKAHIARTKIPGAFASIGDFGGVFDLGEHGIKDQLLVGGTDGVGTKLKLAFLMDKHDTVGVDCVAMCVNDVICCGAKPLFFLDYIAQGKVIPERVEKIVSGIADGCVEAGCALIGGETAEMPGFYPEDEYDLAGFSVGIVNRNEVFNRESMQKGDAVIGIESAGVHSNGFSLIRKIFNLHSGNTAALEQNISELGSSLGDALIRPTRIYVKNILALKAAVTVKSVAHITGGGFYENIPRAISDGMCATIEKAKLPNNPLFDIIMKAGNVPEHDMFNTFNMGVGMCVVVPGTSADAALAVLNKDKKQAHIIGEITQEANWDKVKLV